MNAWLAFLLPFFLGGAAVLVAEILITAVIAFRLLRWTRGDEDVFPTLKGEGDEA